MVRLLLKQERHSSLASSKCHSVTILSKTATRISELIVSLIRTSGVHNNIVGSYLILNVSLHLRSQEMRVCTNRQILEMLQN